MKAQVHPYDAVSSFSSGRPQATLGRKGLKRLPHVFSSVLQLPFPSDTNIRVEESSDCYQFIVPVSKDIGEVRTQVIELQPGLVKVVISEATVVGPDDVLDLELDVWRFRLPESTRPELADAVFIDRELVVTVPKEGHLGMEDLCMSEGVWGGGGGGLMEDMSHLVIVQ